jgi:hypothetical protein
MAVAPQSDRIGRIWRSVADISIYLVNIKTYVIEYKQLIFLTKQPNFVILYLWRYTMYIGECVALLDDSGNKTEWAGHIVFISRDFVRLKLFDGFEGRFRKSDIVLISEDEAMLKVLET